MNDDARPRPPREIAGIRASALIELPLMLGVLLFVDFTFFGGTRFWDASPHPFGVVVLLLAAQYGSREALLGAAASSAALLLFNWPEQTIEQEYYTYLAGVLEKPFFWFVGAVVFGELRMRHVAERKELRRSLTETETHARTLAEAYERLRKVKEALETRVASQLQTTTTMYQAARAIDKLDPGDVITGVTDIVETVLGPEQFSLFVLEDGKLRAEIRRGWTDGDPHQTQFLASSPLFHEVVGRQRIVSCSREEDERVLESEGLLAGPLLRTDTGTVLGMLKIERLGFLRLSTETIENFRIVCEWIATAYGKAVRYQEAEHDRVLDRETHLYSHNFLGRQRDYVSVLARRLGFDLSMVTVGVDNAEELDEEVRDELPTVLRETVGTVLRRTDLAFHQSDSEYHYALLLPGTPVVNARFVVEKLKKGLADKLQGPLGAARFTFRADAVHEYERPASFQEELFPQQTDFLCDLARRFGFAVSMVVLKVVNTSEVVEEDRRLLPGAINLSVARLLSDSSPAFTYEGEHWEYPVVLPGVTEEEARAIGRELAQMVEVYVSERRSRAKMTFKIERVVDSESRNSLPDLLHA